MRIFLLPLLALSFAAGIAAADAWPVPDLPLLCAAGLALNVVYVVRRCSPPVLLASLCALALLLGAFWLTRDRELHPDIFRPWLGQRVEITGTVLDEPTPGTAGWRCRVQVCRLRLREREITLDAPLQLITEPAVRLSPGMVVRASGFLRSLDEGAVNFDAFDYARYAARSHLTASLRSRTPFIRVLAPLRLRPDRRLALALRERLAAVHRAALPEADAALLNSLVFGSRGAPLPEDVEREFRDAGVVHVLVASGTQVTLFVGVLFLLLRCLLLPWWARCAAALAGSWLFALMAGGQPSIVRAGLVAVAVAAAGALGRENEPLSLLAFAALAILFLQPGALFDPGFQLSFAAVGGLILLQPALARCLPPMPRPARLLLSASIAAQLYTLPISAHFFCQAAPVGVLANLVAVPLAGALLLIGGAVSLIGLVLPGAAYVLDTAVLALLTLLRGAVRGCAAIPGGHWWVIPPSPLQTALCYAVLLLLPCLSSVRLRRFVADSRSYVVVVVALVSLVWHLSSAPTDRLRVTFLDVGQGDSILVQAPSGAALLVDGGGSADFQFDLGERILLPALLHRGARVLDYVVLTHPHADHAGGLAAVCGSLPVERFLTGDLALTASEIGPLRDVLARRRIPRQRLTAGVSWMLDAHTRVTVLRAPPAADTADPNEESVILRVDYGHAGFLLTGDCGAESELAMLQSGAPLRAEVLKIGHHGSAGGTGDAFLNAVAPRLAVVSVGRRNRFSLPSAVTLARLQARGIRLYRTDCDGAVEVSTDGEQFWVRTARR